MPPEQFLDVRHSRKAFQSLSVVPFRSILLDIDLGPGILLDEDYLKKDFFFKNMTLLLQVDLFKNSECKIGHEGSFIIITVSSL